MSEELTTQQKIDFIYAELKRQKRNQVFKTGFKMLFYMGMLAYFAYFYFIGFDKLKTSIIEAIKPEISTEAITSGIKDSSSDLLQKAMELYNQKTGGSEEF